MSHRTFSILGTLTIVGMTLPVVAASAQPESAPAGTTEALRTAWGEPDLQGIWNNPSVIPLERDEVFGTREFLTAEEIAAAEQELVQDAQGPGRDNRDGIGTEVDVARAYNEHWFGDPSFTRSTRTSMVVDPPNGRIPPLTPEAERRRRTKREYLEALLQGTPTRPGTEVSSRRAEPSPDFNLARINRSDGPEDRSGSERCFGNSLPILLRSGTFGGVMRVVQSPGVVGIYYDIGQGQGFSRSIPITNRLALPDHIRLRHGDPRGHWEGDTLVVEVTNFTKKTNYRGSRENLHLIERYRRLDDSTLSVEIVVEDPTTWTAPWTAVQELALNSDQANQVYEGGCHEGNYGMTGMLANTRAAERLFAEGRGSDPATQDNATGGGGR